MPLESLFVRSVLGASTAAIVGAGPRGTSVLERLCASAVELLPPGARLTVHVVDPAPPGPAASGGPRRLPNS